MSSGVSINDVSSSNSSSGSRRSLHSDYNGGGSASREMTLQQLVSNAWMQVTNYPIA